MREKTNGRLTNNRDGHHAKVFVIDPDPFAAKFVVDLVRAHKLPVQHFTSGEDFWDARDSAQCGCAVMEIELPGMDGIQLQQRMTAAKMMLPVVVVAGETDVAVAVKAMKSGVVDFLQKPCHPLELWQAIQEAIERDRVQREEESVRARIRAGLETLTDEEELVMRLVLDGKPNKTIANQLGLSVRTIDFRRASILRKTEADSLIELAQMLTIVGHSLRTSASRLPQPVESRGS